MRKIIYGINLTADGCCDHTKGKGSDDILKFFGDLTRREMDLIVYGRKTYELMVPYWPNVAKDAAAPSAEREYGQIFDTTDKIVFSRTLKQVEDKNTRLVSGNLEEEMRRLKQQPGKNISVGGVDLPGQLLALGLIDEFHFVIHPTIAGTGRRLWDNIALSEQQDLKLINTQVLSSGCIALHYIK